jgi:hypothetical protein
MGHEQTSASGQLRIVDPDGGCENNCMTDLNESALRARIIVEDSGGIVRRCDPSKHSMTIEIAAYAVWRVCILPLSYIGRSGNQMLYDVDLSAMRLPAFGG